MMRHGDFMRWRFGPTPTAHDADDDQSMRVDDDWEIIDPTTWPTFEQLSQAKNRVQAAHQKVTQAYAALSKLEK
mgnify:CR=1|jgi:hypothetical protein